MFSLFDNIKVLLLVVTALITIIGASTTAAAVYGEFRVRTLQNEINIEKVTNQLLENTKLLNQIKQDMAWIKNKMLK